MTLRSPTFSRSVAVASATLAGLSTPAWASDVLSTLHIPTMHAALASLGPREVLLLGSFALLVVAVTLRFLRTPRDDTPLVEGPDLRFWKNR